MAQTIKIKRSTGSAAPSTLAQGELAYSKGSDTLYVGDPATVNTPIAVGGAIKNNAGSPVLATGVTAAEIRTLVGVDASGTDNSTDVTLDGTPDYITITGQTITRNLINLTTDVSGDLPVAEGGTGASTAAAARTNLGVDAAGTDNSTDVTLTGTPDYITISGQTITRNLINLTTDVSGDLPVADGGTGSSTAAGARTNLGLGSLATLSAVGAAQITDNTVGAAELNVSGNGTSGQALLSDGDGSFSWGNAGFDAAVDNPAIGNGSAVGTNSSAYGHDATASGTSSIAVGYGANVGSATTSSIAIGTDTDATADSAVALGVLAQATAVYGVAIGQQSAASGSGGVSIGYASSATSDSVALGRNADAVADSISIGANSDASSSRSIAVGHEADALATESIAIGDNANTAATATQSIAIGDSANANAANTIHINASGLATNAPDTAGHMVIETDDAKIEYDGNWDIAGGTVTVEGMTVSGNLTVNGTTTTVNSETIELADNIIELNSNLGSGVAPTEDAGIRINRGSAVDQFLYWDEGNDRWETAPVGGTATPVGSITGVTAGTSLSGGGTSGAVTVNVASGGIGATQLASNAVTSVKINSGAVTFAKLSTGAVTTSAETFTDSDTQLMTAAAIDDLIVSKGYGTGGGDITGVTAGNGLAGGGTEGGVTLSLDFAELADMTADIAGTTEFILQNGAVESRKAASEIKLSAFNNDSGWTSNVGDITSVQVISTDGSVSGTGTGSAGAVSFDLEVATIDGGTY